MTSDRLTWNSWEPAVFESGWSVFTKILFYNHLDLKTFTLLIKKSDVDLRGLNPYNFRNSTWIDFEKLANLLGVKSSRLTTCFLDQLGFNRQKYVLEFSGVRHCPDCYAMGYHCSLFELDIIKECPWHRKALTKSCERCCASSIVDGIKGYSDDGDRRCNGCGKFFYTFLKPPRDIKRIDPNLQATILGYCRELVDWWASMLDATTAFPILSYKLEHVAQTRERDQDILNSLYGFALQSTTQGHYWKFNVDPVPVQSCEWRINEPYSTKLPIPCEISDPIGHSYRSIRRHIYKRYLRPHRKCLSNLLKLTRDEIFSLRADRVCSVALAYLTWRMSNEGVSNIEGMTLHRNPGIFLRLMSPESWPIEVQNQCYVRWSYYGFFGLWRRLKLDLEKHNRIIVTMDPRRVSSGYIYGEYKFNDGLENEDIENSNSVRIIYPKLSKDFSEDACIKKNSKKIDTEFLIDSTNFDNRQSFAWTEGPVTEYSKRNLLFRFTYHPNGRRTQYQYLQV